MRREGGAEEQKDEVNGEAGQLRRGRSQGGEEVSGGGQRWR